MLLLAYWWEKIRRCTTGVVGLLCAAFFAFSLGIGSQPSLSAEGSTVHRIGFLILDTPTTHAPFGAAFSKGLSEHGYVEGKNLVVQRRFAAHDPNTVQGLLTELIGLGVEVLVTDTTPAALAAKSATHTIPIVTLSGDPVAAGLVTSLGHPGGNVTALASMGPGIVGKRLAFLKEVAPRTRRVALLWNPDNQSGRFHVKEARTAAKDLGFRLHLVRLQRPDDIESALGSLGSVDAIMMAEDPLLDVVLPRIGAFAVENRLPIICNYRVPDDSTCLLWYGPDLMAMYQRLGAYTARVLAGTKSADLPVEQPTKFQLIVNLQTAKTIKLKVPESILVRADEVIR